jgi:prophage DNA circulation protein
MGSNTGDAPPIGASASASLARNAQRGATASQAASFSLDSALDLSFGIGLGTGYKTGLSSTADWKETLRPVSYKGVVFPATQIRGRSGRKLVKHVYPYRPGQDIVDLGRQPLQLDVTAVFANDPFLTRAYGKDLYPGRYEQLLAAIHEGTSGELVHPVFGSLRAACESYNDTTQASELNTVRMDLTFVEDDTNSEIPFGTVSALDAAASAATSLDEFAASIGANLAADAGITFADVVTQAASVLAGTDVTDAAGAVEMARMNLQLLTGYLPSLEDPIYVETRAELASLGASLQQAAVDVLAGAPPIIVFTTKTQTTTVDIAKERYHDPSRAREIEKLNTIGEPLNIPPGTELKIYAY